MNTTAPNDAPLSGWILRMAVYPLFLISGAAGLMYEVAWTRLLLAIFGAGIYAVAAVLAAFMAGLALGSWALGRYTDRLQRPLRLYGILEFLIGGMGLAVPFLTGLIDHVDGWAYLNFERNFTILTGLRFGVAFALMLIPTTLMGATRPVLSRFRVRDRERLGLHVGGLYAINTLGAVTGAFLAGFVLIGAYGLFETQCIAAGCNFVVGIVAIVLSLITERRAAPAVEVLPAQPAPAIPANLLWRIRWVLFTAFVTGIVSLASQVMWSRSLIFAFEYLKNTTYSFSAMLTVFLAGLALGSALIGLFVDRHTHPFRLYGTLLAMIGTTIIISVWVLQRGAESFRLTDPINPDTSLNWVLAVFNIMTQTFGVLGIPTLLMGMAFPVAARVVVGVGHIGRDVGRLYALNTLGAIAGSVLAGFVLAPLLGLTNSLLLLGAVDIVLGIATLAIVWRESGRYLLVVASVAVFVALGAIATLPGESRLQPLTTVYDTIPFYREGPLATVAVVQNNVDENTIYVDGVGVAGTDPILQTDQKSLAHVAMGLVPSATSALTVGFGSGGASYSLLLHDRLQKVHCVEICTTVLEASPHLRAANHHFFAAPTDTADLKPGMLLADPVKDAAGEVLYPASTWLKEDAIGQIQALAKEGGPRRISVGDPQSFSAADARYELILDDARSYLRHTTERYDFIATDCTDLRYKSNANLYDLEYFQACRDRLTEQGIVVVWMPLGGLSPDVFKVALRTFQRVFPAMGVFFMANEPTHYILLIGWQDQAKLDYEGFAQMLQEQDVKGDLGELYLDDPVKLLACFIAGGEPLAKYLEGDALNTENNPLIEFESPKYGYGDKPMIDNLHDLMALGSSPLDFLIPATIPPAELERLKRYIEAMPFIIEGHAAYRELKLEEATRAYMKAADLTPEDLSLKVNLLTFPTLQKRIMREPNNAYMYLLLGRVKMIQGQLQEAYDLLDRADKLFATARDPEAIKEPHAQVKAWRDAVRQSLEEAQGL